MTKAVTSRIDVVASRARDGEFCTRVIEESGQAVYACYQCQRCGGGCPVASAAGTTPSQFLRLLALGLADEALKDPLLWLCVGCSMCGARCPNEISTNEVIDRFRALTSDKRDIAGEAKDIRIFHRLFLHEGKLRWADPAPSVVHFALGAFCFETMQYKAAQQQFEALLKANGGRYEKVARTMAERAARLEIIEQTRAPAAAAPAPPPDVPVRRGPGRPRKTEVRP